MFHMCLVIFRVVRVKRVSAQELPVLEQLEYSGPDVPSLDLLERLPKRDVPNPTPKDLGCFHIVVMAESWPMESNCRISKASAEFQEREADSRRQVVYRTEQGNLVSDNRGVLSKLVQPSNWQLKSLSNRLTSIVQRRRLSA